MGKATGLAERVQISELGNIARSTQKGAHARRHYTASYELKEALEDPEGMAAVLIQLARTAQMEEKHAEAAHLYARSKAIYRRIHDQGGLATALHGLGETAFLPGDAHRAAVYLSEARQIAHEMAWLPLTLAILASIAELLQAAGEDERSLALLKEEYARASGLVPWLKTEPWCCRRCWPGYAALAGDRGRQGGASC
jgi:ATP/maltotriose-dependent transcriptional regulator MalT